MKKLYALPGKKYLAQLLGYQLIFTIAILVTSLAVVSGFIFDQPFSMASKMFIFSIDLLVVALLMDKLWNALQEPIFCMGYVRAKLMHHTYFRYAVVMMFVSLAILLVNKFIILNENKLINTVSVYAYIISLVVLIVLILISLTAVSIDIFKSKKFNLDCANTLSTLTEKYGTAALTRVSLTTQLINGHAKGNSIPFHRGFSFAGLTSLSWHDPINFPWVKMMEENYETIKQEALSFLQNNKQSVGSYNYPGVVEGGAWNTIMLVQNGRQSEACKSCPETMALLKLLPGNLYFREAIFSILGPGAKILPHRDFSNVYLTYQLGLSIPPQCAICVGGEERTWKEGKSLIFDTSYEHEAWNDSNSPRLILLVDFFHPDLNEAEQEFLKNVLASA